jgi:hypothetical protein
VLVEATQPFEETLGDGDHHDTERRQLTLYWHPVSMFHYIAIALGLTLRCMCFLLSSCLVLGKGTASGLREV